MPWFREPQVILSRLVGLSTTLSALWLCRKVGCWAKSLGRLGALILRFVRRGRLSRRPPDYGHLLMVPLYPGPTGFFGCWPMGNKGKWGGSSGEKLQTYHI